MPRPSPPNTAREPEDDPVPSEEPSLREVRRSSQGSRGEPRGGHADCQQDLDLASPVAIGATQAGRLAALEVVGPILLGREVGDKGAGVSQLLDEEDSTTAAADEHATCAWRNGLAPRIEEVAQARSQRRHEQDRATFVAGYGHQSLYHCSSAASLADSASSVGGYQSQPGSICFSDTGSIASLALGASVPPPELCGAGLPPVPECLRCPISQQIMEDPVWAEDGRTYERGNVASLGYTGELRPNMALREAIQGYLELRENAERRQRDWRHHLAHLEQKVARKLMQRKRQARGLRAALDQSKRRAEELTGRKNASNSTTASSLEDGSSHSSVVTPTPSDLSASGEPRWKSGPAPRIEATGTSKSRRQPQLRSAWSRLFPAGLARQA